MKYQIGIKNNIKYIKLEDNEPLTPIIIQELTKYKQVIFSQDFDQDITNLPDNITHLILNQTYDREIIKYPTNLISLTFGHYYNKQLINCSSKVITFTDSFILKEKLKLLNIKIKDIKQLEIPQAAGLGKDIKISLDQMLSLCNLFLK